MNKIKFLFVAILSLVAVVFFSCQIGLGAQVDTASPEIAISYPSASSVISDWFYIRGTCSDDLSVASVAVNIVNTDTSISYSYTANIASDGKSWVTDKLNVQSEDGTFAIPDGLNYTVTVTASDKSGHQTTDKRSFSVDNTAPVLVLTKPTSIGSNTAKTYGQTVQLQGSFSEASSLITKLIVSFYDSTGAKLFDSTFSGITDMSNANPLTIAQYYEDSDDRTTNATLWSNYEKLFGSENITSYENGSSVASKEIYFTVTASDNALCYQDESGTDSSLGTGSGNETSCYYRGTTAMLNLIEGKNASFANFNVLALRNYINGTTTYDADKTTALNDILNSAKSVSTTTEDTESIASDISNTSTTVSGEEKNVYLNFSINPQNNPTYSVSGYGLNSSTTNVVDGFGYYYTGSSMNVSVTPGLDETNLDTSTITFYYEKYGDDTPCLLWTWDESVAVAFAMKNDSTLTAESAKAIVDADPSVYKYTVTSSDENTDSLSCSITLEAADVEKNTKYKIIAEGYDINNEALTSSAAEGYGFFAKTNVVAPELTFGTNSGYKNLANNTVFKESVFTAGDAFEFSGTITSAEELTSSSYAVVLSDSSDSTRSSVSTTGGLGLGSYDAGSGTYAFNFAPSATTAMKEMLSTQSLYEISLTITATNSGGTTTLTRTYYVDNLAPSIANTSVSNSSSGTIAVNGTSTSVFYVNNSSSESQFTIAGVSTDNYTLSSTKISIAGVDSSSAAKTYEPSALPSSASWSFSGIDLSGFAAQSGVDAVVTLTATDSAGNITVSVLNIEFDTTAPSWNDSSFTLNGSLYSNGWYNSASMPFAGSYNEEGSGIKAVYYWVVNPNGAEVTAPDMTYDSSAETFAVDPTGQFSTTDGGSVESFKATLGSFKASSFANKVYFKAIDKVGNITSTETIVSIFIDSSSPVISGDDTSTTLINGSADKTLTGKVSDDASGVDEITLTLSTTSPVAIKLSDTTYANGKLTYNSSLGTWSLTLYKGFLDDISALVDITAVVSDKAGNKSSSTRVGSLMCDSTSPAIQSIKLSSSYFDSTANCYYINNSSENKFTLSGVSTDNYTLASTSVSIAGYDSTGAAKTLTPTSSASANWSFSGIDLSEFYAKDSVSDAVATVASTDSAGNTVASSINIEFDVTPPAISTGDTIGGAAYNADSWYNQETFTVTGAWTEAGSGISTIYYQAWYSGCGNNAMTVDNYSTVKTGAFTTTDSGTSETFSTTVKGFKEGTNTLYYVAVDNIGNVSALAARTIKIDETVPTLTETGITNSGRTTNVSFILTGTAQDTANALATTKPVTIVDTLNEATVGTYYPSVTSNSWSQTLEPSALTDGTHTYKITVTDIAGNTASLTRTVVSDKTAPVWNSDKDDDGIVEVPTISTSKVTGTEWFNSTSLAIKAYATDSTSGVSKLQYSLDSGANYSDAGNTGSFTISVSEGSNTIYIRAVDIAGNTTDATVLSANVDTQAPATCTLTKVDDVTGVTTKLTNGSKDMTVVFTASDANTSIGSGISKVTTNIGSTCVATTFSESSETYTVTIPSSSITSSGSVSVVLTDKAGNAATFSLFTIQYDNTAPTTTISSPTGTLNGTLDISGTVTENNNPASISIYYKADSAGTTLSDYTLIKTITTTASGSDEKTIYNADVSSIYNWTVSSFDFNTASGASSSANGTGTIYILPVAYDEADNCSVADSIAESATAGYTKYSVDRNKDRPSVKITDLSENGGTLMYGTNASISGSITDDDSTSTSVVKNVVFSESALTSAPSNGDVISITKTVTSPENTSSVNATVSISTDSEKIITKIPVSQTDDTVNYSITTFTLSTGEWTFTPADINDGKKTVYFYIVDNNNAVFYTANTSTLSQPYVQFKSNTAVSNSAVVTYTSDSKSPVISKGQITYTDASTKESATSNISTGVVLGGTVSNNATIIITATDDNGIAGMTLTATDSEGAVLIDNVATSSSFAGQTGLTSNGSFSATTSSTPAVWTLDSTSLTGSSTGAVSVVVKAWDNSTLWSNSTFTFTLDNSGPTIMVTSPSQTDEVTGTVNFIGISTDIGGSSTSTTQWLIPTQIQAGYTDVQLSNLTWNGSIAAKASASAWQFDFDGTSNPLLTDYDSNTYYTSYSDSIYTLPLYIKSTDVLGNYTIYKYSLKHNPDADKPSVSISYPTSNDYDKDTSNNSLGYVTLGGTMRVTGTVEIPSASTTVKSVYLQIATLRSASDTPSWSIANNQTYLNNYKLTTVNSSGASITDGFTSSTTSTNWWGIATTVSSASTSTAWNISLNTGGDMNPSTPGTLNYIAIRACGVNANGKLGSWSDVIRINIDDTAPTETANLMQYTTEPSSASAFASATASATKDYTADMYLKGTWYLKVLLKDEASIYSCSVKKGSSTLTEGTNYYVSDQTTVKENYEIKSVSEYVYIPVDKTSSSVTYTVSVTDTEKNGHTISTAYNLNIDNEAPELSALVDGNDNNIKMTKQSNSDYTVAFGGTASDSGSGFSRLALYFKRTVGTTTTIELPVPYSSTTGTTTTAYSTTGKTYTLSTAKVEDSDGKTVYTSGDPTDSSGLYGAWITAGTRGENGEKTTFEAAKVSDYATEGLIRVGGLIRIGGAYYTIFSISDDTVTFDTEVDTSYLNAFFPAAFVIDNTGSETSNWSSGKNTISGDDGDGVVEYVKQSGSTWTWTASVYSDELEDGKVSIECAAFDKAENVGVISTPIMISNNAPRLSKVYLATDLNGDNSFKDNELGSDGTNSYYSALDEGSKVQQIATLKTSGFRMTDELGLAFEFVNGYTTATPKVKTSYEGYGSGNGDIYCMLDVGTTALTAPETTATKKLSAALATGNSFDTTASTVTSTASALKGLTIPKTYFYNSGLVTTYGSYTEYLESSESGYSYSTDYTNYISLTLWDSTKGTTVGTKDVLDTTTYSDKLTHYTSFGSQYTVLNIPLYMDLIDGVSPVPSFDPLTKDSAYSETANEITTVYGHVEQKDYLPSSNFDTTKTGEYDTDDKISGEVVFTGTVTDNNRVSTISLTSSSAINSTLSTITEVATYSSGAISATTAASATAGWAFSIVSQSFSNSTGHTVNWTLVLDSSYVASVADSDVTLTLTANDGTKSATAAYRVDIVPYITGITRTATTKSNKTMNRSTYGEYPVAVGDTLTVTGFNFSTATNGTTATIGGTAITPTVSSSKSATISGFTNSGELVFTVNSMVNLNAKNNNGIDNNYDATNTTFYDNCYLRVWDLNHYFTSSTGGSKPTFASDSDGNLFSSWTLMGSATVQIARGLGTASTPVYAGYDQPDKITALSIDAKSSKNGSVLFLPANVGNGGKLTNIGYSNVKNVGGAWGVAFTNAMTDITASLTGTNKSITITGNPKYKIDGSTVASGFQLQSYAMGREVSIFDSPRTVRYGDNLHYAWYDSINGSLKYSCVNFANSYNTNDEEYYRYNNEGWILIDGTSTGIDRLHAAVTGATQLVTTTTDMFSVAGTAIDGTSTGDKKDFSALVATINGEDTTANTQTVSFTGANANLIASTTPNVSFAIMYTDSTTGKFMYNLHDATNVALSDTTYTLTWDTSKSGAESTTNSNVRIAVYYGASNVVAIGANQSSSAGKFISMDVTNTGKPVIVYYDSDANALRIAYSTSATPSMTVAADGRNTWTRQTTSLSGGTYVQCKIDGNNYLHIVYRDDTGKLCYVKSTAAEDGAAYTFGTPMVIDSSGTYCTLSLIRSGDLGSYTYTPCVSFLNSEGTANGVKYAVLRTVDQGNSTGTTVTTTSLWDTEIVPAVVSSGNHFVNGGELVYVEGYNGWSITDTVDTSACDAIVGFNTGRMDVVFLKK